MLQTIRSYYGTVRYIAKLRKLLRRTKSDIELDPKERYDVVLELSRYLKTISLREEINNPADWFTDFKFKSSEQLLNFCIDYNNVEFLPSIESKEIKYVEWLPKDFSNLSLRRQTLILNNLGIRLEKTILDRDSDKRIISLGRKLPAVISDLTNLLDVLFESFSIGEKND